MMGLSISWQQASNRLARIGTLLLLSAAGSMMPALAQSTPPATSEATAAKPIIHAQLNGSALDGTPSSYCWPAPGQNPCVLVEDPQPASFAPAKAGDSITFSVDPNIDSAATLSAQLLDVTDATGNPTTIDLTASKGVYVIDPALPAGSQRIEVQVAYPQSPDGNQNYVRYVFGLKISASVAANNTAQATASAVAVLPTEATSSATVATQAATPVATSSAISASTNTPSPTVTATKAPSKTATKPPTVTSSPTATAVPPTATPTELAPSATVTQTPSVTPIPGISVLPSNPNGVVPTLNLLVGGKSYDPVAVTAFLQDSSGALVSVTRPLDSSTPLVVATGSSDAQIQFNGPQPLSELITLQNADATKVLAEQPIIAPGTLILYALPTKPGLYTLYVAVQWPQGQATYIFRLQIN